MRAWVTLEGTTLREWFYASTPAEERAGDVACVDFDANVRCERVTGRVHVIDTSGLDPVRHCLVLFYWEEQERICVAGLLPWRRVLALRGYVCAEDLMRADARSRACVPPPPLAAEWEAQTPVPLLALPAAAGPLDGAAQEMLRARLAWYLGAEEPPRVEGEKAQHVLSSLVGAALEHHGGVRNSVLADARILRLRYEEKRLHCEKKRLYEAVGGLHTQGALVQCLAANGMRRVLDDCACDPTALDLQWFLSAQVRYVPTVFLRVPATQVPHPLPLYRGGYVHLPMYAEYVADWLWQLRMADAQRMYAELDGAAWGRIERDLPHVHAFLVDCSKRVACLLMKHPKDAAKSRAAVVERESGTASVDVEDLWAALPPCVASLRYSHFPRHLERLQLTPILHEAGVSAATAEALYADLNGRYPRDGQELKRRYNVAYEWTRAAGRETYCATLMKGGEGLACPYVQSHGGGIEYGDELRSRCYHACAGRRFGGKPALRLAAELAKGPRPPVEEARLSSSSSSSDETEESSE